MLNKMVNLDTEDNCKNLFDSSCELNNITERKQKEKELLSQANMLDNVYNAVFAIDENDVIIYWNKMAEAMFGYTVQEAVGKSQRQLLQSCTCEVRDDIRTKLYEKGFYAGEHSFSRADGKLVFADITMKIITDELGNHNGAIACFHDITERKRYEQRIEELKDDLTAEVNFLNKLHLLSTDLIRYHDSPHVLFEEILDVAIQMSQANKGNILLNKEGANSLHTAARYGLSERYTSHLESDTIRRIYEMVSNNKARVIIEDVFACSMLDAQQKFYSDEEIKACQVTPLISSAGNLVGILSTYYPQINHFDERQLRMFDLLARQAADVIERVICKEALAQSYAQALDLIEELHKTDEMKNKFINILSHEIRNPLASIMMSFSLLEIAEAGTQQAKTALEVGKRQAKQLANLVDDMMDVSRITTNKIKLKKKSVELNKLIEQCIEEHKALFAEKGVELAWSAGTEAITLEADPARLKQVIGNLLQNAAKFTANGQQTTVVLSKDTENNKAVISVQDTGSGIAPEILPNLFKPFVQGNDTLDRAQGGLGLGLSIVRGIVELHGGCVSVYSEGLGQGSTFTVRLPLSLIEKSETENRQTGCKSAKPLRIMVIEDMPDIINMLCPLLRFLGHQVVPATNGVEGISRAKEFHPDVLFCDLGLPGMSGYEIADYIRNRAEFNGIFLVALSGYAKADDIERTKKAGFNRHLAKPVDLAELKNILAEAS